MLQQFNSSLGRATVRRLSVYFTVLAALLLTIVLPGAFAQTHVANPFVGAKVYVNPDYTSEVATAIATEPAGSTLASQMTVVGNTPTFVWLDRIAAVAGGSVNSGRLGLQGHINAAVAQANGAEIIVPLVIYDLPDRDCAALASNGELSIAGGDTPKGYTTPLTGTGIQEYENDYITPIYNILAAAPSNVRFVLVIEDDSLPNIVTNTGYSYALANCIAANGGSSYPTYSMTGVYVQGIQYALNKFHSLPNAYNYLDIGHHGWLGWTEGASLAFPFYANVAKGTTAGFASLDGIITNTANYGPTKEPFMTATESIGGNPVDSATFYSYDPEIDELDYAEEFYTGLTGAGFPTTLGFLIDTSRNGWGGPNRPTAASTSTVLNTFVDASKIDERDDMGQWCNQEGQGIGAFPTVNPGGFANLQAYVWVKPPGESDGDYPDGDTNPLHPAGGGDENCDPAHSNALANGMVVGSIPNSPPAGAFWITEFLEDVQNAYPAIPVGNGFSITTSAVSAVQGTTATSSVAVSEFGTFSGTVTLSISTLPTGVTAAFSPASITGSAGSTLTFTVSATAVPGTYPLTVTGTSGTTTETAALSLTVVSAPTFTIVASSTTVSLPIGTNPTDSFTITFLGGLTGSVSVSASGLPSGMQANFSPSSVNAPGGTVVANFSAQSSTPAGSYPIKIVGTNGTITQSAAITITIPATGFTLAPSATSLTVVQGKTATDTITITDLSGFSGSVTLAASGLPSGVTAAFGTNPTTGSSVLTLTATSTATTGASTVTITGTSGSITATTTIALTVSTATGFTLAPSASSLSVTQAKTATDTITVTDVGGFTGSVTLAASGLPSGVTAAFATNPATSTSVLTFTATSTATTGTSTVTITGTSGTTTATTTITLTVSPSSGFTLAPSATSLSVTEGSNGTDTITVTDVGGFTGSVTLAASGLPSGVTAAFATNPTTGSSILTLTASSTATTGTATVTITGTSGTTTATTTIALTVNPATTGTACHVVYTISSQWGGGFGAAITIQNTGTTALSSWTLTWAFANGQTISQLWNGAETQSGANVTVNNLSYNGSIPAGGSYTGMGFNGTWNNVTNAVPTSFAINGTTCK
jgi:cellulose 1,4-beta-cellobiosidase